VIDMTLVLPKLDTATVDQREYAHVVVVDGNVIAGPFLTEEQAWHWIDRNEVYETWER
jgi:hypothetical protein